MPSSSPTNRRRGVQLVKSPVSGGIRSDRPDVRHPLTNGIGVVESKPMLRKRSTSVGQYRRRVLRLAGVVLLAGLAAPPAAVATPNFGDFGQSDGVGTLYGTRSEIRTPSAEINWGSTTGETFAARVVGEAPLAEPRTFLVQIGYGELSDSSVHLDACGTRTTFHRFNEYSTNGSDFTCNWFGPPGTGHDDQYAVKRVSDNPHVCAPDCWTFAVNGSAVDQEGLGRAQVAIFYAGEEFNNCSLCVSVATAKNAPAVYGASGTTDWQWTNQVGGATWFTVQPGCGCGTNTDGQWSRGNLPTPFTISH